MDENTSDKDMSGLQAKVADAVKAKGYQVVSSPDKAYYWIQANVLKADKMDLRDAQKSTGRTRRPVYLTQLLVFQR